MRESSIMESCKWCGEWFAKRGNQKYCCAECRRLSERQQARINARKMREEKRVKKKNNDLREKPKITLDTMVDLMLKLSKEKGRTVQYGEVQRLLLTDRLKVRDGVIV